jgi:hypothetical protein
LKPIFMLWDATAVTGVATFKSGVTICARDVADYLATFDFTSTAAGVLSLEINNKDEAAYRRDVAAAGSEAANTTGWQQRDLSPTATITVTAASSHNVTLKGRMVRFRFSYANASGSGAVTGRLAMP